MRFLLADELESKVILIELKNRNWIVERNYWFVRTAAKIYLFELNWWIELFYSLENRLHWINEFNLFIYWILTHHTHTSNIFIHRHRIKCCVCKELHLQEVTFTRSSVHKELRWTNYYQSLTVLHLLLGEFLIYILMHLTLSIIKLAEGLNGHETSSLM